MNSYKTEFLLVGDTFQLVKSDSKVINVIGELVSCTSCIRLLGSSLDENLTFKLHVTKKAHLDWQDLTLKNYHPVLKYHSL